MTTGELLSRRLSNQKLVASRFSEPHALVEWFGAMQAQEYTMAKWAIALRVPGATDIKIEDAFNCGSLLRTHVLRPTWHFVAPEDIRWMLALTAPRVRSAMAYMNRRVELDARLFKRGSVALEKALSGGKHLTRAALQETFKRAKITADGIRLAHLLMDAELDGLICSGPRQGKTFTYALLDERVPTMKPIDRDAALARLTHRYFTSRGPATAEDFAWWSGLTIKDARNGISSLGRDFIHETINGRPTVFPDGACAPRAVGQANFLQPDYDEYGIAYKDRSAFFASASGGVTSHSNRDIAYNRMIVIAGQMVGSWRRIENKGRLAVEAIPFGTLAKAHQRSLINAVTRYAAFLGEPIDLNVRDGRSRASASTLPFHP